MAKSWQQSLAIQFCTLVEEVCPPFGCHVALTGGCLYKGEHSRKDIDILFYRVRQEPEIKIDALMLELERKLGVTTVKRVNNWLIKAKWCDRNIDIFFHEEGEAVNITEGKRYDD